MAVPDEQGVRPLFLDPDSPQVRSALKEAGQEIVDACLAELAGECEQDRKARLLLEIAAAQETLLEDHPRAAESYLSCLEIHPDNLPAIRGARRISVFLDRVEDALGLFDKELRLIGDTKRKAALYRLKGRLLEDRLGRLADAKQCYVRAAKLDPDDFASWEALAQIARCKRNWKELAEIYESQANAVHKDDRLRAAIVTARGRLFENRIEDEPLATELYKKSLELDPDAAGSLGALERLLYRQQRWRELAEMLAWEVEGSEDPHSRSSTLLSIAQIQSERLGDAAKAQEALIHAAGLDPDNRLVLERLARYYKEHDDVPKLVAVLIKLLNTVKSVHERVVLSHSIGELLDRRLGDEEEALRWYTAALSKSPAYAPAVFALERLYIKLERWNDLMQMMLAKAEVSSDSRRRSQDYARVAELFEKRLDNREEAIHYYDVALSYDFKNEGSFKSLMRLYRSAGMYKKAIDLYERAVERVEDDLAVPYLFEIGKLYEVAMCDPSSAAGTYKRVLDKVPGNLWVLHTYQRACETASMYKELAAALEKEIELVKDPARTTALMERVAEIYEDYLGDRETALYRYRKVLDLDPSYPPAVGRLERFYEDQSRHNELIDMYEREIRFTGESSQRIELLCRMAKISEDYLSDDSRAASYYRRALVEDPRHHGIFEALTTLLTRREQWDDLVELYETRCRQLEGKDTVALARICFQLGQVHENQRSALKDAARAYGRSLEAEPGLRPALDGLIRVYAAQKNWGDLASQLKRAAALHEDAQSAADALLASGDLYAERLGDKEHAVAAYESALERQPNSFPAFWALSVVNRQLESWERLAVVYRGIADATSDDGAKTTALLELARLFSGGLGSDEDVKEVLKQVATVNPRNYAALYELERHAIGNRDIALRIEVDRRYAAVEEDEQIKTSVLVRLAQFLELNRWDEALMVYRECLSMDPNCFAAMRGLQRVARSLKDPKALAEALEHEARWTENGAEAASRLVESAQLHWDRLSDPVGAVDLLEEALRQDPDDERAADLLTEKLYGNGEMDRLIEALSAASRSSKRLERKSALRLKIARIQADEKDNIPAAIAILENLLSEHQDHIEAMVALAALYSRNRQWTESADVLERVIKCRCKPDILFDARFELGKILARHLNEPQQALKHARELVRIKTDSRPVLVLFAEVKLMLDDVEGAREIEGRLLASADAADERAQTYFELACIEGRVGGANRAVSMLKEAVALSGPFGEAGEELRRSVEEDVASWNTYADALGAYLRNAAGKFVDSSHQLDALIELSRVQHEKLGETRESVETLKAGLEQWGTDARLPIELSARLLDLNQFPEAIFALQEAVEINPFEASIYQPLYHALWNLGGEKEAAFALEPLVVLGAADLEELQLSSKKKNRPGLSPKGAFNQRVLKLTGSLPTGWEDLAALLRALGPTLARLQPSKFEELGVSRKDRIGDEPNRLGMVAQRVMQSFPIEEVDLYTVGSAAREALIALEHPPVVLLPESMAPLPEAQQVFMVAPLFAQLTLGLHAAVILGEEDTRRLLAAVLYKLGGQPKAPGFPEDDLENLAKQVLRATPRRNRKQLEDTASGCASVANLDIGQCISEARTIACRAGALLAGDLPACVTVIETLRKEGSSNWGGGGQLESDIADLLGFWTSQVAFEVRRACGLI